MFRIKEIDIENFGSAEYPEFGIGLHGDSLFIHGTNNTGKTTTLDGIIYSIFGYRFIDRSANTTDDAEITLTDGETEVTIERKYNQKDSLHIRKPGEEMETVSGHKEILDHLIQILDLPSDYDKAELVVRSLILPQRTEDAPLRSFTKTDLKSAILTFSSGVETSERIQELKEEIDSLEKEFEELTYRKNNLKEDINDDKIVIQRNKNRVEDLEEFVSSYRSGELFELKELLENESEIKEKLEQLYSERTATYDELIKTRRKIGELQRYHDRDVVESAKETLSVLTCPVCSTHVDAGKVEGRKSVGQCPFCGKDDYSGELYETLEDRIEYADNEVENLREKATKLEERKEELEEQIQEVKRKNQRLENANPVVVRALRDAQDEEQLEESFEEYRDEYHQLRQTVQEKEESIKANEEVLEELLSKMGEYKSKINELKEEKNTIKEEVNQKNIQRFNEILDSVYSDLIDPLDHTLYFEDGEILLDTGNTVKECTDKHTLGFSQRRLVDVALWLTFLRLNQEDGITALDWALFDDIYENIDNSQIEWKDHLLDALGSLTDDVQLVTCSIDKELNSRIGCESMKQLQYQTDLSRFGEEA